MNDQGTSQEKNPNRGGWKGLGGISRGGRSSESYRGLLRGRSYEGGRSYRGGSCTIPKGLDICPGLNSKWPANMNQGVVGSSFNPMSGGKDPTYNR